MDNTQKRLFKKNVKRRMIEILASIPFGVGFAYLFFAINLSVGLQLFLTVVCWGAVIVIIEIIFWLISKTIEKKNITKPKKRDPFSY